MGVIVIAKNALAIPVHSKVVSFHSPDVVKLGIEGIEIVERDRSSFLSHVQEDVVGPLSFVNVGYSIFVSKHQRMKVSAGVEEVAQFLEEFGWGESWLHEGVLVSL
jgi:hypothetical protein